MAHHHHRPVLLAGRTWLGAVLAAAVVLGGADLRRAGADTPPAAALDLPAERPDRDGLSVAINAGLLQPLVLGGANLEVDLRWRHLVVAYSHGWSLALAEQLGDEMTRQRVTLQVPYTTGLGVGGTYPLPALRSLIDLRLEAKVHRFSAEYTSADGASRTRVADYHTYTLGGGVYWTVMPFAGRSGALRGLNPSTSVRYWPTVATSLAGDARTYFNATTNRDETHHAANIGIANSPLIVNVSVGYLFR